MNNDEFYEFEDRAYVNPTLSSGEQEAFINSLRDVQGQNNAQIAEQTYNLGTAIPSNLGGLGGGEAYFTSRYQTPQVGDMVSNLKAAAQAQALSDVMSNYQTQLKQRYNQAYRSAKKRAAANSGGGTNQNPGYTTGGVDYEDPAITPDTPKITDVPIDDHNTSAFMIGSDYVLYDETTGDYYVNGVNRGKNPSTVSMHDQRVKGSGGGGGNSW